LIGHDPITIHNCIDEGQRSIYRHTELYGDGLMRDILLQISGALAIVAALIHGVLAETKVFPRVTIEPRRLRTLFRMVWQVPTVAWVTGGVLLIAAPTMASAAARHWIVVMLAVLFAFSAIGNAVGTGGKHFGWIVLGAVATMAVAGF
jgi:hypothetical protein